MTTNKRPSRRAIIDLTCQNCGQPFRLFLRTYKATRKHYGEHSCVFCGRKCAGEFRTRQTHTDGICQVCGKKFTYRIKTHSGHYCSLQCRYRGYHKPGTWIERICETCGKRFMARTCSGGNTRFCSRACAGITPNQIEKICLICGTKYFVPPCRADKSATCSIVCKHEWQRRYANMFAADKHRLNRKSWKRTRAQVVGRDNHTCQHCGATSMLHVHHIIPWALMKSDDPNNLITLCAQCHYGAGKPYWEHSATTA